MPKVFPSIWFKKRNENKEFLSFLSLSSIPSAVFFFSLQFLFTPFFSFSYSSVLPPILSISLSFPFCRSSFSLIPSLFISVITSQLYHTIFQLVAFPAGDTFFSSHRQTQHSKHSKFHLHFNFYYNFHENIKPLEQVMPKLCSKISLWWRFSSIKKKKSLKNAAIMTPMGF